MDSQRLPGYCVDAACGELPASLARYTSVLAIRAASAARRAYADAMAPTGIRPRHHAILLALRGEGPVSQQLLGRYLEVDPGTVVDLVDELERLGLVERRRNPADRRAYQLHLTAAGDEMLARTDAAAASVDDGLFGVLSDAERARLHAMLFRVVAAAEADQAAGSAA